MINRDLLEILACPKCKGPVKLESREGEDEALICDACRLRYEIRDDIPVMLIDKATALE